MSMVAFSPGGVSLTVSLSPSCKECARKRIRRARISRVLFLAHALFMGFWIGVFFGRRFSLVGHFPGIYEMPILRYAIVPGCGWRKPVLEVPPRIFRPILGTAIV